MSNITTRRFVEDWEYEVDNIDDDVYDESDSSTVSEASVGEQEHVWKDEWDGEWTEVEEPVETREFDPREGLRDDKDKRLWEMLQEDRLQPSDLMAMKAKYTREGKWKYELSNRKRHIKDLFEGEEHELDIALRGEAQKSQPVPRTTMICTWKGADDEEYAHATIQKIKDEKTDEFLQTCGFHTKRCIGYHSGMQPKIEIPNKHGLCLETYKEQFYGTPPKYDNPLLVPGVVLVKQGMRKHPLVPDHYPSDEEKEDLPPERSSRTTDSLDFLQQDENLKHDFIDTLSENVKKAFTTKKSRVRKLHKAAATIQSLYRMLAAKRTRERLERKRKTRIRQNASRKIQTAFRVCSAVKQYRKMKAAFESSAVSVQRVWRVHQWQRKVDDDIVKAKTARKIQQWIRVMWQKENFRVVKSRIAAQMTALRKDYAKRNINRILLGHTARFRYKKMLEERAIKDGLVRRIQRLWVIKSFGKKTVAKKKKREAFIAKVEQDTRIQTIQRWVRYCWRCQEGKERRLYILQSIISIQSRIRVFLARKEAKLRKMQVESAWAWLSPKFPRRFYEQQLPLRKESYEKMFGEEINRFRVDGVRPAPPRDPYDLSNAGLRKMHNQKDREKSDEMISLLESRFLKVDVDQLGMITRQKFWSVLKDVGVNLTPENGKKLADFFVIPESDKVSWIGYLRFAQGHGKICPLHRVIVCPECLYLGPCPLSGCMEFVGVSHSLQGEPVICRCGFHISRHLPALRSHDHITQETQGDSADNDGKKHSGIASYIFAEAPEMPRAPEGKGRNAPKGVKLRNTTTVVKLSNGRTVQLSVANPKALDITQKCGSLALAKAQTKIIRAYLRMSNYDSEQPYKDIESKSKEENTQHEYLLKQKLKRDVRRRKRSQRLASQKRRENLLQGGQIENTNEEFHSESEFIDPSGRMIRTERKVNNDGSITFQTDDAAELGTQPYQEAIQEALYLSSEHINKGKHFGHHPDNQDTGNAQQQETSYKISALGRKARLREAALMSQTDTAGGVLGAGRARKSLPFEKPDGIGPDKQRSFTLSRPVAIVHKNQLKLTTDSCVLYLFILRALMGPTMEGYDILADENRLIKFLFDHHSFIDQHWKKLIEDIRTGTLHAHLPIAADKKAALEAEMQPNTERASILETIFESMRYKSRAEFSDKIKRPEYYIKNMEQSVGADGSAQLNAARKKRASDKDAETDLMLPKIYPSGGSRDETDKARNILRNTRRLLEVGRNSSPKKSKDDPMSDASTSYPQPNAGVKPESYLDEDGTRYEFGYMEAAKRPYLCLHPGCGESFASTKAAGLHVKNHGASELQIASGADHFLAPVWKAAGIGEWPGEEVIPPQREQPIETQVRVLLSSQLKSSTIPDPPATLEDGEGTSSQRRGSTVKSIVSDDRRSSSHSIASAQGRRSSSASGRGYKSTLTVDIFPVEPPPIRSLPTVDSTESKLIEYRIGTLVLRFCGDAVVTPPYVPPKQIQLPSCPSHQWLFPKPSCVQCKSFRLLPLPQAPVKFFPFVHMFRYTAPPTWLQKCISKGLELQLYSASKPKFSAKKRNSSRLASAASNLLSQDSFRPKDVTESICDSISTVHLTEADLLAATTYSTLTLNTEAGTPLCLCIVSTCIDSNDSIWLLGWRLYGATGASSQGRTENTLQSDAAEQMKATEQYRVCGRKMLYVKVRSENILNAGIAVRTKRLATFKQAVRHYRREQILEMQRVRTIASNKTTDRALQSFDMLRSESIYQNCYFFSSRISADKEQSILIAEAQLTEERTSSTTALSKKTGPIPSRSSVRFQDESKPPQSPSFSASNF